MAQTCIEFVDAAYCEKVGVSQWPEVFASRSGIGRSIAAPWNKLTACACQQLVVNRIVGTGGEAALQERRDHVERGQPDDQPDRRARERADLGRLRLAVLELAVEQQHRRNQHGRDGEADEGPGVIVIAEQRRAVAGVVRHDVQQIWRMADAAPAVATNSDSA